MVYTSINGQLTITVGLVTEVTPRSDQWSGDANQYRVASRVKGKVVYNTQLCEGNVEAAKIMVQHCQTWLNMIVQNSDLPEELHNNKYIR